MIQQFENFVLSCGDYDLKARSDGSYLDDDVSMAWLVINTSTPHLSLTEISHELGYDKNQIPKLVEQVFNKFKK